MSTFNIEYIFDYNRKSKTANVRHKMTNEGEKDSIFIDLSRNYISLTSFVTRIKLRELSVF